MSSEARQKAIVQVGYHIKEGCDKRSFEIEMMHVPHESPDAGWSAYLLHIGTGVWVLERSDLDSQTSSVIKKYQSYHSDEPNA